MMKRIVTCFLAAALFATASQVEAQVRLGAFGGVSHFNVDQEVEIDGVDLSSKLGLAFGALVEFEFHDVVSFQLEPMLLHKGS